MKTLKLIARARRLKLRPVAGVRFRWSWLGGALLVPALCGQVAMAAPRIPVAPGHCLERGLRKPADTPHHHGGAGSAGLPGRGPCGADVYRRPPVPDERQPVQWHSHVLQPGSNFGDDECGLRFPRQLERPAADGGGRRALSGPECGGCGQKSRHGDAYSEWNLSCWRNCLSHQGQYSAKFRQQIPHGPCRCGGELLLVRIRRSVAAFFSCQ